jgi:hypothetical protein
MIIIYSYGYDVEDLLLISKTSWINTCITKEPKYVEF